MMHRVLSLKGLMFSGIVVFVSVAVYMEMKTLGMKWDAFLRAVAFYGIPSIFLPGWLWRNGAAGFKKGLFFKMVLFSFILAAIFDFVYKQAERFGLT